MSYSGSGRVMNMLKSEKSLKRTNSWSLFGGKKRKAVRSSVVGE